MELNFIQTLCIWAIPVLFAITVHECAHGYAAYHCGDKTAFLFGRLTLNPAKHIDIVGTLIVPMLLLWLGGFLFGWAKPVPVNPRFFKRPRRDTALVALAGPLSNALMALFWAMVLKIGLSLSQTGNPIGTPMSLMGMAGVQINLVLCLLNLLPIPPLDGSRVVSVLLPPPWSLHYNRLEPYGFFILIFLIASGLLGMILSPLIQSSYSLLLSFIQLPT